MYARNIKFNKTNMESEYFIHHCIYTLNGGKHEIFLPTPTCHAHNSHISFLNKLFFSWKFTRFRAREMSEHISRYTSERQFSQTCKTSRRVGCSEMMVKECEVWAVGKIKNYHHSSEKLCFKRISDTANISHVMCVRSRSFSS